MEHGAWSMEQLMNMLVPEPVEGKKIKPSIPLMLFELSSKSYEGEEVVFFFPSTSSGTTLKCHFSNQLSSNGILITI